MPHAPLCNLTLEEAAELLAETQAASQLVGGYRKAADWHKEAAGFLDMLRAGAGSAMSGAASAGRQMFGGLTSMGGTSGPASSRPLAGFGSQGMFGSRPAPAPAPAPVAAPAPAASPTPHPSQLLQMPRTAPASAPASAPSSGFKMGPITGSSAGGGAPIKSLGPVRMQGGDGASTTKQADITGQLSEWWNSLSPEGQAAVRNMGLLGGVGAVGGGLVGAASKRRKILPSMLAGGALGALGGGALSLSDTALRQIQQDTGRVDASQQVQTDAAKQYQDSGVFTRPTDWAQHNLDPTANPAHPAGQESFWRMLWNAGNNSKATLGGAAGAAGAGQYMDSTYRDPYRAFAHSKADIPESVNARFTGPDAEALRANKLNFIDNAVNTPRGPWGEFFERWIPGFQETMRGKRLSRLQAQSMEPNNVTGQVVDDMISAGRAATKRPFWRSTAPRALGRGLAGGIGGAGLGMASEALGDWLSPPPVATGE